MSKLLEGEGFRSGQEDEDLSLVCFTIFEEGGYESANYWESQVNCIATHCNCGSESRESLSSVELPIFQWLF